MLFFLSSLDFSLYFSSFHLPEWGFLSQIRTVTIFGVIRMGVHTTPDRFGAGTETIPDRASVNI